MPPADARFRPGRLVSSERLGGGLSLLAVDPGPELARSYVSPGQYVEVLVGGETGYFVLASEPGEPIWHLAMKSGGGASDVLLEMPPGSALEVRGPLGAGFPMAAARGRPLVLALGGTGIAAARPLVRPRIREGDAECTTLLVGLRQVDESAFTGDLEGWVEAGILLRVCVSQGGIAGRGDRFVQGRIPDALLQVAASAPARLASALVFCVGAESLVESLRQAAPVAGIAPSDVVSNY